MSQPRFEALVGALGAAFALAFGVRAFAAGFVNPFSTGDSLDVFFCTGLLFAWIFYKRSALEIRHGWIAVPLSFAPGVATRFDVHLLIRSRQLKTA